MRKIIKYMIFKEGFKISRVKSENTRIKRISLLIELRS